MFGNNLFKSNLDYLFEGVEFEESSIPKVVESQLLEVKYIQASYNKQLLNAEYKKDEYSKQQSYIYYKISRNLVIPPIRVIIKGNL